MTEMICRHCGGNHFSVSCTNYKPAAPSQEGHVVVGGEIMEESISDFIHRCETLLLAELKMRFRRLNEERESQHTRADEAEAQLATDREDAELLDWLEQYRFENPEECAALVGVWIPTDGSRYPLGLRSAIRAAMKEKAK